MVPRPDSPTPDPGQDDGPALIVTFGATRNKRRLLVKPTTVLGRGPHSDIGLNTPEVAAVHCLIARTAEGLAIRDCGSRAGTLVNGRPIREAMLANGDELQVGPFSFQVSIPAGKDGNLRSGGTSAEGAAAGAQLREQQAKLDKLAKRLADEQAQIQSRRQQLQSVEQQLREQQQRLAEREVELQKQQQVPVSSEPAENLVAEAQSLRDANERLERQLDEAQGMVAALREQLANPPTQAVNSQLLDQLRQEITAEQLAPLQEENDSLRARLAESEGFREEATQLQAQVAQLEAQQTTAPAAELGDSELREYEQQLNDFRDQLEQAQNNLQEQERVLEERGKVAELELSRARAEIARDKGQLERLRHELQVELEHAERDAEIRKRLAGVQRLTDEVRSQTGSAPEAASGSISERIRSFFKRTSGDS